MLENVVPRYMRKQSFLNERIQYIGNHMTKLFAGAWKDKGYVIKSILLGLVFWILQYAYQYFFIDDEPTLAIIRSSAFTGATLIGIALIIGPLQKLWPSKNYIKHRRTLGVLGFTFILAHYFAVMAYVFNFNLQAILLGGTNPYVNPVIFGLIAFWIYIPLYLTSTDWATQKLGYNKWKMIHRLVYFAWIVSVLHFILINPEALFNLSGYILMIVTALVFILEISAFIKHAKSRGGKGRYIGLFIIIIGALLFYTAYTFKESYIVLYGAIIVIIGLLVVFVLIRKRENKENAEQTKQIQQPV